MNLYKIILYDIKQGIIKKWYFMLLPLLYAVATYSKFLFVVDWYRETGFLEGEATYMDYWIYLFGGMKEYTPSPERAFEFPIVWIIVIMIIVFLCLNYPLQDMNGIGSQILIATKNRSVWWLAKYMWVTIWVMIYHLILIIYTISLSIVNNIPLSNTVNKELQQYFYELEADILLNGNTAPWTAFVLPILLILVLCYMQLTLSLFIKPIYSFMTIMTILIVSSYIHSPVIIGNFGMLIRSDWIMEKGMSPIWGLYVLTSIGILSIISGLLRFKRYSITI